MTYPKLRLQMFRHEETQNQLANEINMEVSLFSRKLNKQRKFTEDEKQKIANHYNTTVEKLF